MKSFSLFALGQALLAAATPHGSKLPVRQQGNSFAGVSSFFLHAFKQQDRLDVLDAIKDANLKVLRIFISPTGQNFKNTGSITMPDIEPQTVGVWDDTQLKAIDQLMVEAQARGIKLTIATSLAAGEVMPMCQTSANNVEFWYSDKNCISDFQNRIRHVLEHKNTLISGSPAWKDLNSHIFAFNIQNEGQGHLNNNIPPHPSWWCDRAGFMRGIMGSSKVLISTGGGNEFPNSDVAENWACQALDLVTIHSYMGVNEFKNKGPVALQHAKSANKLMLFEKFGATGSSKSTTVGQHIDVFNGLGVPWMPWQISKPGNKANDYEFWTDEATYDVVEDGSNDALAKSAAQTWSI
ncbi:glycoside hydrolase [Fusarium phyllophilum]|uniref:Glycoside hydrolase n=1 Tax=Fusarium phyllophilum TaxID=47803 RepID=A0A8H5N9Z6_9HYPO|nr:glycoside hydrolase [Fusarium phyllophilum]